MSGGATPRGRRRPGRDRLLTWYFTGPVGHFVAGFADWVQLLGRYAWARARGRSLG